MIVISGASASGKTEVAKIIAEKYNMKRVITVTTRQKRKNEVDTIDYFFTDADGFKKMIENKELVEYTNYNGNYYGSRKDQIADNKILVIDSNGLKKYISLHDKRIVTFVLDAEEMTRYERMLLRGDKKMDVAKRLASDRVIYNKDNLKNVDYFLSNENTSIEEMADIVYKKYKDSLKRRHLL